MIDKTSSIAPQMVSDSSSQESGRVLMRVEDLRKSFGGHVVLSDIDLELCEGEVILLRGENGSGKTTLLNILTGNIEPDAGDIQLYVNSHAEHFRFPRRWWQELNPWDHFTPERVANEGVGRTWQDTRLFGSQTLLDNLAVAQPNHPGEIPWSVLFRPRSWRKAEAENRIAVQHLLSALGLGDRSESSADMISLGQSKRIAFARCAHANTKIIFLDEPLAGLDQKGTENVISVLRQLAAAHNLTLVIVEHVFNIPIILDFATAVWTLADGQLTRETIAEAKADPAVQATSALPAIIHQIAGPDAIITEEPLPRGATLTRISRPGTSREPLLTLKNLAVRRGQRIVVGEEENGVVTGLDLTVHKGELVVLQAPNGWGKTSLLDALAGILPCQQGSIQIEGLPLERKTIWERRVSGLVIVPARDNVFSSLTVAEYSRLCDGTVERSCPPSGCTISRSRMMSSLSGGERKRLALESGNQQRANVRIWDEPFTSLDKSSVVALCRSLMPTKDTATIIFMPSKHKTEGS